MISQSSLPEAISTQPAHMEKQCPFSFTSLPSNRYMHLTQVTQQSASIFTLWALVAAPQNKVWGQPEGIFWGRKMSALGVQSQMRTALQCCRGVLHFIWEMRGKNLSMISHSMWHPSPHSATDILSPTEQPGCCNIFRILKLCLARSKIRRQGLQENNQCWQAPLYFKKLLHLNAARSWGTFSPTSSKICPEDRRGVRTVLNHSVFFF